MNNISLRWPSPKKTSPGQSGQFVPWIRTTTKTPIHISMLLASTAIFVLLGLETSTEACFPSPYSTYYPSTYTYPAAGGGAYPGYGYGSAGGGYGAGANSPYMLAAMANNYNAAGKTRTAAMMDARTVDNEGNGVQELDEEEADGEDGMEQKCMRRFDNYRLHCVLPFERRAPATEVECQTKCLELPRCKSFQFEAGASLCDLFEAELAKPQQSQAAAASPTYYYPGTDSRSSSSSAGSGSGASIDDEDYKGRNKNRNKKQKRRIDPAPVDSNNSETPPATAAELKESPSDNPLNCSSEKPTPSRKRRFILQNGVQPLPGSGSASLGGGSLTNGVSETAASGTSGGGGLQSMTMLNDLSRMLFGTGIAPAPGSAPGGSALPSLFPTPTAASLPMLPTLPTLLPTSLPAPGTLCTPSLQPASGVVFVAVNTECLPDTEASEARRGGHRSGVPPSTAPDLTAPLKPADMFRGELEPFSSNSGSGGAPSATLPSSRIHPTSFPTLLSSASSTPSNMQPKRVSGGTPNNNNGGGGRGGGLTEVIPDMPDCLDGGRARVQLVNGIALTDQRPMATVRLQSADSCMRLCRANAHFDGTRFARVCKAATFHRPTGRCELLDETISPNGELNYAPDPESVYFEKICIPEAEVPLNCDDVIQRIPQHTLDTRAVGTGAVLSASSQLDCVRKCIGAEKRLGFACQAASHFFDWTTDNCLLSRFTRAARPDIYVAERKHLVDYLELPACFHTQHISGWQHDDAETGQSTKLAAAASGVRTTDDLLKSVGTATHIPTTALGGGGEGTENEDELTRRKQIAASFNAAAVAAARDLKNNKHRFLSNPLVQEESENNGGGDPETAASPFGDGDYGRQRVVSFFGPPHRTSATDEASAAVERNDAGQKMVEEKPKNEEQRSRKKLSEDDTDKAFSFDQKGKCNPRKQCCPKAQSAGLGPRQMQWGCSIGYRITGGEEGGEGEREVPCLPEQCQ